METKIILENDCHAGKHYLSHCDARNEHFYFSYQGKSYDMENRETVLELQKLLVKKADYESAKTFNDFLIRVTRLKGLDHWLFYPSELQIEHTNRCNARCIMCGHYNADHRKCRDIDPAMVRKLEPMFPFCRYIGLHGYGEPFLTRRLPDYFKLYKKYGIRLYANTNLSYMPEEYIPYIRDMFDELNVSCESVNKETYEKIRKGLSFERFVTNIDRVHSSCPHVRLNFFIVIMRQNLLELPAIVDFAADHGFSSVQFTEMIAMEANDNYGDNPRLFPNLFSEKMKEAILRAKERKMHLQYPAESLLDREDTKEKMLELERIGTENKRRTSGSPDKKENLLFDRKKISAEACKGNLHSCKGICDVFSSQLYCSLDGKYAACCVDGYHYTEKIGDVQTMEQYWESDSVRLIRSCFQKGELPGICYECNFILLNQLKFLEVDDRQKYQNMVNAEVL